MYKNRKMLLSLIFILLLSNIYAQENLPKKTTSTEKVQTRLNF